MLFRAILDIIALEMAKLHSALLREITCHFLVQLHPNYTQKHVITPHAQRERGKVIGCGVHIYI